MVHKILCTLIVLSKFDCVLLSSFVPALFKVMVPKHNMVCSFYSNTVQLVHV